MPGLLRDLGVLGTPQALLGPTGGPWPPPWPHGLLGWSGNRRNCARSVPCGPFQASFVGFWRFLALRAVCSPSRRSWRVSASSDQCMSPLFPALTPQGWGILETPGTGPPKDGSLWEWITRGITNPEYRSLREWVTLRMGHPRSRRSIPGERSHQIQLTPGMGHPMSKELWGCHPKKGCPQVSLTPGTGDEGPPSSLSTAVPRPVTPFPF